MVEYTIAICNYNEADSVEQSVDSVLSQVDDRFEVLVVDDGSTDGSVEILERMEENHEKLRVIALPPDDSRKLGQTRTFSIEEAQGNHVILHIDTDNYYEKSIGDFVEIYEQIRTQLDHEFYFLGKSFAVTQREFILEFGPYRNLPVGGEDRDLWRRLASADRLICLDHEPVERLDGWNYSSNTRRIPGRIRRTIEVKTADFQVGISLASYLRWAVNKPFYLIPFHLATIAIALVLALPREKFSTPAEFRTKGTIDKALRECMIPLSELETEYGVQIQRERLSQEGRKICDDR